MVRYSLDDITDQMVLGEAITLPNGKLLLGAGYKITERYKDRLKDLGYRSLLINVPGTEDVNPEPIVSERAHSSLCDSMNDNTKKLNTVITKFRTENTNNMAKLLFSNRRDINKFIMQGGVTTQLNTIVEQIFEQNEIVLNMAALKKASDSFFDQSVNVAVTAICIGKKHKFDYSEIKQLATGALNYHIGFLAIRPEILKKESSLTDQERNEYKQHTTFGYLMLAQNSQIPATSSIVALQHHELQNGKGYPLNLKGTNSPPVKDISQTHVIHRFAEIVAVADTYHALLPGDSVSNPNSVRECMKKLILLGGECLNKEIVKTLISVVPLYPIGTRLKITRAPSRQLVNCTAVVAKDNPTELGRPQIVVYENSKEEKIKPPIIINTANNKSIDFELI